MTYLEDQRWVATVNPDVAAAVLALRDDVAFNRRFYAKVDERETPEDTCHVWTAALSNEGYGNFTVGRFTVRAHRVAWILQTGKDPGYLYLDHVWHAGCRYRFCVRPSHLELINQSENVKRGQGIGRSRQRAMRDEAIAARDAIAAQWKEAA